MQKLATQMTREELLQEIQNHATWVRIYAMELERRYESSLTELHHVLSIQDHSYVVHDLAQNLKQRQERRCNDAAINR